jgi:spermidine synthase
VSKNLITQPIWKKWMSYFREFVLDAESSNKNGELYVLLKRGRLMLATENAIYSWDDLYANFDKTFKALETKTLQSWNHVLVLGMGLASIPFLLEKKYQSKADFTLVEYDAAVIELAQYYSLPRLNAPHYVYQEDALDFTLKNTQLFDCICVDIFVDQIVPDKFHDISFLNGIKQSLTSQGILIFNKLYLSEDDKKETETLYELMNHQVFEYVYKIHTKHNMMLIGSNIPQRIKNSIEK